MIFSQAIEEYIRHIKVEMGYSPTTIINYQNRLRYFNNRNKAPTGSFFASLKRELTHHARFATQAEAKAALFDWLEAWYNRKRRHSMLGYVSPEAFEQQYQKQQQPRPMAA